MVSGALKEILEHAGRASALVVGPGMGTEDEGGHIIEGILREVEVPVLLDASDTLVVEGEKGAVNSTGAVALATAGTGDVLSGVIGALLSRGMDTYEAARAGAWVHGRASELWVEETGWPAESFVATDLLDYLPRAVGELF